MLKTSCSYCQHQQILLLILRLAIGKILEQYLFLSSKQLVKHGHIQCWHPETQLWFNSNGISINALTLFQYRLNCPHLNMNKVEKNRVISPTSLRKKMACYKTICTHIEGWIHHQDLLYGHASIPCIVQCEGSCEVAARCREVNTRKHA